MLGTVIVDVAVLVFAVGFTVSAPSAVWFGRKLSIKVGNMHATVEDVNKAVNNVPAGTATLTDRVDTIERTLAGHGETLTAIAVRLNVKETPK